MGRRTLPTPLLGILFLIGIWFSILLIGSIINEVEGEINSIAELEKMINTERKKLGIGDDVKIYAGFGMRKNGSNCSNCVVWNPGNNKEFWLNLESRLSGVLRHEMYHIYRVEKQNGLLRGGVLRYLLIEEPLAVIYSITGLDLTFGLKSAGVS